MSLQIGSPPKRFQSTWDTTQTGVGAASDRQVSLPLESAGTYNFQVDWGDGKSNRDTITAYNQAEVTHTYDSTGVYEIRIIGGITGIYINTNSESKKIKEISLWGPLHFRSGYRVFRNCENLVLKTTDTLDLSHGPSMRQCFDGCYVLGSDGNIGSWDVSNVTRVRSWFNNCRTFNEDLSNWDTSGLGSISDEGGGLFSSCYIFNNGGSPGISGWDVSNWSNSAGMNSMFQNCRAFNQPIGPWDVSNVTNMKHMFQSAANFNNGGSPNISGWDTSSVTNMQQTFRDCSAFNQPIGTWNTSKVTTMYEMFRSVTGFNQDISNWDVSGVTTMYGMFSQAHSFNNGGSTGINNWDTSSVTNMTSMFYNCDSFNQPIGDWDVSSVTTMSNMFYDCQGFNNGGSSNISGWDTSSVTSMYRMFNGNSSFNQNIGSWDVGNVTNMYQMLLQATSFNNGGSSSISGWDTSSVTDMYQTFRDCSAFNQPIGTWNTSKVTTIYEMFRSATGFNQDISNWDVTGVTTMYGMFSQGHSFNQPIGNWTTSSLTNIRSMLYNADAFDQDLSNWNVSNVTDARTFMIYANGLSTTNYDRTLSGWSSQAVENGVSVHFGGSQYSTATGAAYRATLVSKGWTITDGGSV